MIIYKKLSVECKSDSGGNSITSFRKLNWEKPIYDTSKIANQNFF